MSNLLTTYHNYIIINLTIDLFILHYILFIYLSDLKQFFHKCIASIVGIIIIQVNLRNLHQITYIFYQQSTN